MWVAAGSKDEKKCVETVMTDARFHKTRAEFNPFGTCLFFYAEEYNLDILKGSYPEHDYKIMSKF